MMRRTQEKNLPDPRSAIEIKTRLLHLHWSIATLARRIHRPRTTVSQAIHHHARFPKVRAAIEHALWS